MKILPQLEPYPSNLSLIRRPETPSGSVPNRSLKMQNLTKFQFYAYFIPISGFLRDPIVSKPILSEFSGPVWVG